MPILSAEDAKGKEGQQNKFRKGSQDKKMVERRRHQRKGTARKADNEDWSGRQGRATKERK
jgi:hypothetical protein